MSSALCRVLSAAFAHRLLLLAEQTSAALLLHTQQCRSFTTSLQQHDSKPTTSRGGKGGRGSKHAPVHPTPAPAATRPSDALPSLGRVPPVTVSHHQQQQEQQEATDAFSLRAPASASHNGDEDEDFTAQLAGRLLRQRGAAISNAALASSGVFGHNPTVASVLRQMPGNSRFSPEALSSDDVSTFTSYLRSARMGAPSAFDLGVTVEQGRPMRASLLRWERLLRALQPHEAADPAQLSTEQLAAAAARSGVDGADAEAVAAAVMDWVFFRRCCELLGLQQQLLRAGGAQVSHQANGKRQQGQQQQEEELQQQQQEEDLPGWHAWFFDWTLEDYADYLAAAQQGYPTIFSAGADTAEWQEATSEKLEQSARVVGALVGAERTRPLFLSSACLRDLAATTGVTPVIAREVLNDFYKLKRLGFTLAAQELMRASSQSSGQQREQQQQQQQQGTGLTDRSTTSSSSEQEAGPVQTPRSPSNAAETTSQAAAADLDLAQQLVLQELQQAATMSLDGFAKFLSMQRRLGPQGLGAGSREARLGMLSTERIIAAMTPAEKAAVEQGVAAAEQVQDGDGDAAGAFLLSQEQQQRIAARCRAGVSAVEVGDVLEQYSAVRRAAAETLREQQEATTRRGAL